MKAQLSRERLEIYADHVDDDIRTMARMLLALMGSKAVAALRLPPKLSNDRESAHELNTGVDTWNRCIDEVAKLNGQAIAANPVEGLHPSTVALVNDFATALAEKLRKAEQKYGYSDAWTNNGWMTECQADFHRHIAKGDPRDVAAYCAFMWYHGWKTELPAPSIPSGETRVVSLDVLGAACGALQRYAPESNTLKLLRRHTFGDLSNQHHKKSKSVPNGWPKKLTWSYHDDISQAEVSAWNSAIDACRAAMQSFGNSEQLVSPRYTLPGIDMSDADCFAVARLHEIIYGAKLQGQEAKLLARFMLDVKQRTAAPEQEV